MPVTIGFEYNGAVYCLECSMEDSEVPVDEHGNRTNTTLCRTIINTQDDKTDKTCKNCGQTVIRSYEEYKKNY